MAIEFDDALHALKFGIEKELKGRLPVPQGYLSEFVREKSWISSQLDAAMSDRLVRYLETIYGTEQEDGHVLKTDFTEWYPDRMADIDFYYWSRLRKYWLDHSVLPVQVVGSVDNVTNEIMGFLGDPQDSSSWLRSGLVMGHVQSGKTTNYSALISKAADAGYRIIIVLAGLTNSLRFQTQIRLDQTFVGKSSLGDAVISEVYPVSHVFIGQDSGDYVVRHPFCGTTQQTDFKVSTARAVGATEGNFADPILFVTKKHESVLARLTQWLLSLNHGQALEGPMLLIDDEADNASVNTAKDPDKPSRINQRIRELLKCSRRTSYVGYTATPFANIFIDPDTTDDMFNDTLFPRHFIKSLEPPDNYIGAQKLFAEDGELYEYCIREILNDYVDLLPLRHKSGHQVDELPPSLLTAVMEYILFKAIRILDCEDRKNSSMLVNVSRFNAVQQQVHDEIYRFLQSNKEAIDVWAASASWMKSEQMLMLQNVWEREYSDVSDYNWDDIREVLKRAVAQIEVRLVNMRGGGLDYTCAPDTGLHVIAVGGLALARGLTLEGLAVSYVLRNVGAADTLLQMGRWFGYRPGYEKLCRIHATDSMLEDFQEISAAVEELRDDLVRMERMKRTPDEFGLKVRQSPTGIAITAANKMRTAKPFFMAVDLSIRHLQAFEVFNSHLINQKHLDVVKEFVSILQADSESSFANKNNALVWKTVQCGLIEQFISKFDFPQIEFAKVNDNSSLLLDYIADRKQSELKHWDIAIPYKTSNFKDNSKMIFPLADYEDYFCRQRFSGVPRNDGTGIMKFTEKNVVADVAPRDIMYGEDSLLLNKKYDQLKQEYVLRDEKIPSKERCYLGFRQRPLLIIHIIEFRLDENRADGTKLDFEQNKPVVSLSVAFPGTGIPPKPRQYAASVRLRELMSCQLEETETDEGIEDE